MSVKVSVIVPVYNAERYIVPCMESLLEQTLRECEFIFVNDGSRDNSRAAIERYMQQDHRIKLIDQENQGVSMARNAGLERAVGEYVGFVDADDYIESDMFELLYDTARRSGCDAIISNFESELNGHQVVTRYPFPASTVLREDYIAREILPYFIKHDDLNTVCSKLYKGEVLRSRRVKFPKGVALGEDGMFNLEFFRSAAAVQYIDYTGYHYREVAGSATRNILQKDYFQRALDVYALDLTRVIGGTLDKDEIRRLQSIKLIHSVMSYIYIYFTSPEVGFGKRYALVKKMIHNVHVREALPAYIREMSGRQGRYDKYIVELMKRKSTFGLYCATAYSRLRNK